MDIELTDLEEILLYLETTSLEPHNDYTSEFTYKDQKILYKYIKELQQENDKLKEQQKEFIKYLENIIQKEQKDLDDLCDIYKVPKENNSTYKFLCSFIHRIEEILLKYKEITGDDK